MKLSIVIPVFNEEDNIMELYRRLTAVLYRSVYEIIFVDDGSTDKSFHLLSNIAGGDNSVKVIQFTRNFGQRQALMAGFEQAKGEVIITLDADLQNPPEEIPKLLGKLNEGYEVVFGVAAKREDRFYRKMGSAFAKWTISKLIPVKTINQSGFRALRAYTVAELSKFNEKNKWIDGLLCWMGYKVGVVEVEHNHRYSGKSKYNLVKLITLWVDMVVSFTDIPIKLSIFIGSLLGLAGIALAIFYLLVYFISGVVASGFTTIVILVTFFSGVQLFMLGLLGEYVGRMHININNRPEYVIKRDLNGDKI